MIIDKPGIYRNIDVAEYHADPAPTPSLSQSLAKILIDQSPLHASVAHPRLTTAHDVDDDTEKYVKAKVIGDAAHKLMILRGKDMAVADFDDWRKKEAKEFREAAEANGQLPILREHMDTATKIVFAGQKQLFDHQEGDCFTKGAGEVALIWQEGPIWFRCLVDWLHDDLRTIDDYKTTGMSVAPHVLGARAADGGWHIQAAMIERGLDVLDPDNAGRRKYRFVAQEQNAPYGLNVMVMTEHWLTMGRKQLQYAVDRWSICIAANNWPGYPPFAVMPEFPGFKENNWLQRELAYEADNRPKVPKFDPKTLMAG
jgi:hypothetical protein